MVIQTNKQTKNPGIWESVQRNCSMECKTNKRVSTINFNLDGQSRAHNGNNKRVPAWLVWLQDPTHYCPILQGIWKTGRQIERNICTKQNLFSPWPVFDDQYRSTRTGHRNKWMIYLTVKYLTFTQMEIESCSAWLNTIVINVNSAWLWCLSCGVITFCPLKCIKLAAVRRNVLHKSYLYD